jgi:hypothetical protein
MVKRCLRLGVVFFFAACSFVYANAAGQQPAGFLQLSSIGVETVTGSEHISFSFEAQKPQDPRHAPEAQKSAKKSLEYFFIGLALSEQKFWVNLNPNMPEAMIDPSLRKTDLGRIILAADLLLKKDVAGLTNPKISPAGREYWDKLYAKAETLGLENNIPVANRVWIIPEEAEVSEQGQQVTILNSRLRVCLESEYAQQPFNLSAQQKELAEYGEQLMRELILPELNRKVNESPAYIDLRAAYRALILAKWYKEKFSRDPGSLVETSFSSAIEDSDLESGYEPSQIYQEYLASLRNGEYKFSDTNYGRLDFYLQVITRDYFCGGVDFNGIKIKRKTSNYLAQKNPLYQFDLIIPRGTQRPLRLAKSRLVLKDGSTRTLAGTDKAWLEKLESLVVGLRGLASGPAKPERGSLRAVLNQL